MQKYDETAGAAEAATATAALILSDPPPAEGVAAYLVRYEAARQALAEAHRVDEVKDIRDKAVALQVYAQQAKDRDLIEHATEIRLRAERRLGEMMAEQPKAKGGGDRKSDVYHRVAEKPGDPNGNITLAQAGIDKNLAHRARTAAAMTQQQFEAKVTEAKKTAVAAVEKKSRTDSRGNDRQRAPKSEPVTLSTPLEPISFADVDSNVDRLLPQWRELAPAAIEFIVEFEQVRRVIAKASALEVLEHDLRDLDAERDAYRVRLRATRRGGQILIEMRRKGLRAWKVKKGTKVGTPIAEATLSRLGVSKNDSSAWQKLARLSDEKFEALLDQWKPRNNRSRLRQGWRPRSSKRLLPPRGTVGVSEMLPSAIANEAQ